MLDLSRDPKYKEIKEAEKNGTLPEGKGNTTARAAYHHKMAHMYEIVEYDDGTTETRIKPDLIVVGPSDDRGRIFLDLDQVDLARKILRTLKAIDKNVGVDPSSALSEEEILGPPPPPPSKGGRGNVNKNRKIVRIRPA